MTNIFAFTRLKYALNIVFDHLVCFVFISATGLELVGGDGVADGGLAGALAESFSYWFGGATKTKMMKKTFGIGVLALDWGVRARGTRVRKGTRFWKRRILQKVRI